jgi:succinate dehydrogenase / fumarate reductase flavoprotein subunit
MMMMSELHYETKTYDVLVIGAGGAGLRAAIEASAQGVSVALVTKSLLGKAHTVMAEGGMAAALGNVDAEDGWKPHFKDTIRGGKYMSNWRMAQIHAQEAPERVKELEKWGAVFDRTPDGKILQRAFGGHTYRRLAHVGDRTGLELIRTLQDKGIHCGIDVFMECTMTHLLKDGDAVAGAFGYWRESGRFVLFRAKSIVMASGGIGKSYKVTSNSWEYTADGHALALRAGAELIDMEFLQFHPTGMVCPPSVRGLLVTEAVRGEGGHLLNNQGERFMKHYDPERMELSTRDRVALAIYEEVKAGRGTPNGGAYLDISHRGADYIKRKLPSMYHQFLELGDVDITKGPMEVGPTMHYTMGGIRVDAESQETTTVKGLYAAGECSGGLHGSNRLGGNSLSDLIVFGRRAGLYAAERAKQLTELPSINPEEVKRYAAEVVAPFERSKEAESPFQVHAELQELMNTKVGIVREATYLEETLVELAALRERAKVVRVDGSRAYNPGWHLSHDLMNMIMVSEIVTKTALQREESRGGHTRLDIASKKDVKTEWQYRTSLATATENDTVHVGWFEKESMPKELEALFDKPEELQIVSEEGKL